MLRILITAMIVLIGAVRPGVAEKWELARFSFASSWDSLPAIVAIERGFFAEQGIVASGIAPSSIDVLAASLGAGSTDFALVPQRVMLILAASETPITIVAMAGYGTEMELIAPKENSSIRSPADLKGKTIGVDQGNDSMSVLVRLVNQAKIRLSDITLKPMTADQLTVAFRNKTADAVFDGRHLTGPLVRANQASVVVTKDQLFERLAAVTAQPLLVRTNLIQEDPGRVQRFVTALVKAQMYIRQDRADAARLLQVFFHRQGIVVPEVTAQAWVAMTHYDRFTWEDDAISDANYNGWALAQTKVIDKQPQVGKAVENRFARLAMTQLAATTAPAARAEAARAERAKAPAAKK